MDYGRRSGTTAQQFYLFVHSLSRSLALQIFMSYFTFSFRTLILPLKFFILFSLDIGGKTEKKRKKIYCFLNVIFKRR